ncbi:hypothetical protein [Robertmurraya kyonggiensis]|uniref:Uncharacterized protein n=1 Tax=Robertmurraya kyonggiensis TaxID=1037680 RepID=A0A4U1DBZ5_9BACI|nr:hypothetical protein [Robertmurraya kyonggiensis]TKC20044.1 hypothetical protein FA727_11055 [Robertmurraya kyonggiensis]
MDKTVTFSFSSKKYEGTEAKETFTFKELGIDEDLDDAVLKTEINRIFQAWAWDKLNISYSIVFDKIASN